MLISKFQTEFSYNQFVVYDSELKSLGNDWTDSHFDQGFSRLDSSVGFRTLLEFGLAQVQAFDEDYVFNSADERVIAVPFFTESGRVIVEGPEENLGNSIIIEPGHYRLTSAQLANYDETLLVRLYFFKLAVPATTSKIIVKDEELYPLDQLIEPQKA